MRLFLASLAMSAILPLAPAQAAEDPFSYLPMVPMEKIYEGLGGKIRVDETVRPLPRRPPALQTVEVVRKIGYLNFPPKTIVSTFSFDPATGNYAKETSTSAFSKAVFHYHPPLVRAHLPFRKGDHWEGEDGQNTIHDRVWGKVRITLPAGTFVCWVVRRRLTYDLISRRSTQILYEYYAKGVGFVGEGGWSATGKWHWSKRLLSFKMGTDQSGGVGR
ncbi:MAG: hypothetical protein D084_Lepto4C00348G0003 [Leptospirillum sp. Group IV 'UBA BS']|nr:MAG: hypothetical protein D084_Lepto4C00348G0003 [Leptospirillum sp. Group IV 'UBA BS']